MKVKIRIPEVDHCEKVDDHEYVPYETSEMYYDPRDHEWKIDSFYVCKYCLASGWKSVQV